MTTFNENIEISGEAPDMRFNLIYRNPHWELTVTGVKDVETGEEETMIWNIPPMCAAFAMALFIDFPDGGSDIKQEMTDFVKIFLKDVPDYLSMIPPTINIPPT